MGEIERLQSRIEAINVERGRLRRQLTTTVSNADRQAVKDKIAQLDAEQQSLQTQIKDKRAQVETGAERREGLAQETFGQSFERDLKTTREERLQKLLTEEEKAQEAAQKKIRADQLALIGQQEQARTARAFRAAEGAAAPGFESTAAAGVGAGTQFTLSQRQDELAQESTQLLQDLQEAIRTGRGQFTEAEVQKQEALVSRLLAASEGLQAQKQTQLQKSDGLSSSVDSLITDFGIEGFANMSVAGLTRYINSKASAQGITDVQPILESALAKHSLAVEIRQEKDQDAKANLTQTLLSLGTAKTKEAAAIESINSALNNGEITQEAADQMLSVLGIEQSAADSTVFEAAKNQNISLPQGTKYKYNVLPGQDGINVDVKTGQQLDDPETAERDEGQCGAFVNDIMGKPGLFGDTFESKKRNINRQVPVAGAAFVMDTGDKFGHTGIVESINSDGSINVVESNFYNRTPGMAGQVSRRTIQADDPSIIGYYAPAVSKSLTEEAENVAKRYAKGDIKLQDVKALGFSEGATEAILRRGVELVGENELQGRQLDTYFGLLDFFPTRLVDNVRESDRIKELVRQHPNEQPVDILMRRYFPGGTEGLDTDQQNVIDKLINIGFKADLEPKEYMIPLSRGEDIEVINDVEGKRLAMTTQDPDYLPANIEKKLQWLDGALKVARKNSGVLGKAQGLTAKALIKVGVESVEAQRLQTLFDFVNAPTRVSIAGTATTANEASKIAGIQFDIAEGEENLLAKIEQVRDLYLEGYNVERDKAGLEVLTIDQALDGDGKLRLYQTGKQSYSTLRELGDYTDITNILIDS